MAEAVVSFKAGQVLIGTVAGEEAFGIFLLLAFVAIGIRLAAGSMDRSRIHDYFAQRGARVKEIHWRPFGRGWFGERGDRIYEVRYVDERGYAHDVHCKTSLFSGVYVTQDARVPSVAPASPAPDEMKVLADENERLRRELESVKKSRAGPTWRQAPGAPSAKVGRRRNTR